MKQNLFALFLALLASVGFIYASNTQVDGIWYNFSNKNKTATVTYRGSSLNAYLDEYSGSVIIPETVTYAGTIYSVTSIGASAFQYCSKLTSVTIPESVTSIEEYAFSGTSSLTSVTIPNSVKSIGDRAFYNCSSLTSINVKSNNPYYSSIDGVLFDKYQTTLVQYPIGKQGAYTIPNSVTSIGDDAFYECYRLTSITIPNSVTSIGDDAFYECSSLTSITIPNSVTSIGDEAFSGCRSLSSITIPNSVTSIGYAAFRDCSSLTSVTLPESVTTIREYAFRNCTNLSSISLPTSLEYIRRDAFENTAFYNDVTNWENDVLYIDNYLIKAKTSISGAYTIRANTLIIAAYAFEDCTSLTSVIIPQGVTSIDLSTFAYCSSLTKVSLPEGLISIANQAFSGCKNLRDFTIPQSVVSIGSSSFDYTYVDNCLLYVKPTTSGGYAIKDGTRVLANDAFFNCTMISSITIPASLTHAGAFAFSDCSNLLQITSYAEIPPVVGTNSFTEVRKSIPIYVPCGTVNAYKAANGWKEFTNIQEKPAVHSISVSAEMGNARVLSNTSCGAVITAYPPIGYHFLKWSDGNADNPRTIQLTQDTTLTAFFEQSYSGQCGDNLSWAFDTTTNTLTIIGFGSMNYASAQPPWTLFRNKIDSVVLPEQLTYIDSKAFESCRISSINIPNTVKHIAPYAFEGCLNLTSVTIPNNVETIQSYAFYFCSDLKKVVIGEKVASIDDHAFDYCNSLDSIIVLAENPPRLKTDAFASVPKDVSIEVPCGQVDDYQTADGWNYFDNIHEPAALYNILVTSQDSIMGFAQLDKNTICGTQISATPNYGYHFVQWNDGNTDTIRTLELTQDISLTAEFAPNQYTITTRASHNERGTTEGDTTVNYLDSVTITANSNYGYHFVQWNDGNTEISRQVQVTEDKTYTAEFEKNTYSVSLSCNNELGSVKGTTSAQYLDTVTISASPNYGYHFVQWSDGNTDTIRTLELTEDITLTAEFAPNQYTVTTLASHNERGTTQGDTTVNYLEYIPISAAANYGYHFVQWNDGNTEGSRQVQVTGDTTYTAEFEKNTYSVSLSCNNELGSVKGAISAKYLDAVTISATPNYGYHFVQWSDGSTDTIRTLELTQEITLAAEFAPNKYTITTVSSDTQRGTTQGDTTVNYLDSVTITANSNYGYHFVQWNDGNTEISRQVQVTEDKTYTAEFEKNTYSVYLFSNEEQGAVESVSAAYLDTVTISATPNVGYHFVQWNDGNTDNPRTLVLKQDITLTAEFAQSFSGQCGDSLYWELVDTTLHITGSGPMYDYNSNTAPWKLLVSSSKTLTIAEDVTMIGNDAFDGCTALESIVWNAVKEVKQGITIKAKMPNHWYSQITAWVWTTASDGHVVYPTYEKGWYVVTVNTPTINIIFRNGTGWTGDSNQTVDLFYNENVYLELQQSGYTKATAQVKNHLGSPFFDICSQIKSFTFGDAVERIPAYLCYGMDKLTTITIPSSVTSIGDYAFYGCSALESVVWNAKNCADASSLEVAPFYGITSQIKSFTFGDAVEHVPAYLCYGMDKLTSVIIPNNVKSIGRSAFEYCSSLTSITCEAETPPTLGSYVFSGVSKSIPVYVPCGQVDAYKAASDWSDFTNIQEPLAEYSIEVNVDDSIMGTAKVDKNNACGSQISATPNYGYHFVQWNDGNTDNPRTLELTQDITLTAEFALNQYTVTTLASHNERGTTQGDTTVNYLEYIPISAAANYGYHFTQWNDGNTEISRQVQVTGDTTYTAAFEKNTYSISLSCNNELGSVKGATSAKYLDAVTISATPNVGYHFVQWNDGNTDNPRTLVLTQDITLTAEFAQSFSGQCGDNLYWELVDTTLHITGKGEMYDYKSNSAPWYLLASSIKVLTIAEDVTKIGYDAFDGCTALVTIVWNAKHAADAYNDGQYNYPVFYGIRSQIKSFTLGENVEYIPTYLCTDMDKLTSVTIPNSVTSIGGCAFDGCSSLASVTVPNSVTSIGKSAFEGCSAIDSIVWNAKNCADASSLETAPFYAIRSQISSCTFGEAVEHIPAYLCYGMEKLTSITTPNSLKTIGTSAFEGCARLGKISLGTGLEEIAANAFAECKRLYDIYTYATYPPFAEESSFANYNVYVYIPCEYQRDYTLDVVWGKFNFIECIESEDATTDGNVTVDPGFNDVTITWPTDEKADSYSLVINKAGEPFCTLTFNADGQLLNIAFAPGRSGSHVAPYALQTVSGYRFTVTGLAEATKYAYDITTKDAEKKTIAAYSGEFSTKGGTTTAVEDILQNTTNVQKLFRNGQLIIVRDGVEYNAMGQKM